MVFLTGPRQVGKTTLARSLAGRFPNTSYLNHDSETDREILRRQSWDRSADLVILDEIHKEKKWKTRLKGIYDTEGNRPRLLVTGSARLDLYRRGGDSLAGRYFLHRLYPFSVKELEGEGNPHEILSRLMRLGGFPEPFFGQSDTEAARWRQSHVDRIVREDIQDLEPVRDIRTLLVLVDLLRERVGSSISFGSLARDLEISPHTLKRWVQILENMYVLFVVPSYHRNLARAILKEPKIYFYDSGAVRNGDGAKLENTIAVCLRKWLHYLEDTQGKETALHYIRDKEKREVDFAVFIERRLEYLIEVKLSDANLSRHLHYYFQKLKSAHALQLVHAPIKPQTISGISLRPAGEWLAGLDL